jgi:hypothetical protein
MRDHMILLCDVGRLLLLQRIRIGSNTSEWREVDSVDTRNEVPNASITSVSISRGYFMVVGSKLWLYKLVPVTGAPTELPLSNNDHAQQHG